MRRMTLKARLLSVVVLTMLAGVLPMAAQAATAPNLGSAANFAVLAGTALTCTDANVAGPVGVNFTTAFASTRCKMQVQYAPGAYSDFRTAYTADLQTCDQTFTIADTLAGLSLGPGTYCFESYASLTGTLTLTGGGPWLFQIGTGGTGYLEATNFTVVSDNPCNAFWWVRQYATLTTSTFQGTILGGTAITMTGTSLEGRALATGAVTMTGSNSFGCNAAGTVASHHCNQGVGNGPEGCDPGNSNQGDPSRSNDELGGTPGNPGRKGGNHQASLAVRATALSTAMARA